MTKAICTAGLLFSNLGNGVELRVIRWNDDTRYDVLGTFNAKDLTVGKCGIAEFVLRLAPDDVGRHIDFVLHNAGTHICDATALKIRAYTNVQRAAAQTDVTEKVQANFPQPPRHTARPVRRTVRRGGTRCGYDAESQTPLLAGRRSEIL